MASLVNGAAQVQPRLARLLDALVIVAVTAMVEALVWIGRGPGDPITGPRVPASLIPLLLAVPLWWRRRRPLLACTLVISGMGAQALISGHAVEGLYSIIAAGVASYSVAAYSPRSRAVAGLAVVLVGYGVWAMSDPNVRDGRAGGLWAASFFAVYLLAVWLAGMVMQARRDSAAAAARSAAVEREAERAVAEERARVARDLHDIVSHNLSIVVVQAAGGRARTDADASGTAATLEKIEASGRQALVEMRRLLGVLRTDDQTAPGSPAMLAPTPGIDDLQPLIDTMRAAGVDVSLAVETEGGQVPAAVGASVYRIVQEALTNVLKHAGPCPRVDVAVRGGDRELTVTVTDNGCGPHGTSGLGHGLRGMRERVALLGGEFDAGGRAGAGFAVSARLPVDDPA